MATPKELAQERKATRVVDHLYMLSRQVADDMPGDHAANVTENVRSWIWMLNGSLGPALLNEAWDKLHQASGNNPSDTGINPSLTVRSMVLDTLDRDLQADAERNQPTRASQMTDAEVIDLFNRL